MRIRNKIEARSFDVGMNNSQESNTLEKLRKDSSKPEFWSDTKVKVPKEIVIEQSRNLYP